MISKRSVLPAYLWVSFVRSGKVDMNRKQAHPRFTFLKSEPGGLIGDRIKWNNNDEMRCTLNRHRKPTTTNCYSYESGPIYNIRKS